MTQRNELKKFIFSFTNGDFSLKILPRRVDVDGKKIIIGKSAKKTEWTKFINYRKCEHIPMELLKYRNQWSAGWQIGLVYHFKWLGHQHGLNIGKCSGFCGQPALPLDSCFYIPLFLKKNIKRQTLWNLNHTHSFNMHLWRCCCCRWWWWRQWISIYKL